MKCKYCYCEIDEGDCCEYCNNDVINGDDYFDAQRHLEGEFF